MSETVKETPEAVKSILDDFSWNISRKMLLPQICCDVWYFTYPS